ncbi:hypothetical protein ACWGJP_09230 [Microbacterium sp. NPDC055903]
MSNPAPASPASIRARRIASLILGGGSGATALLALVTFALRNAAFLSDGARGLPGWQAAAVDALPVLPFTAMTALLLVATLPPHEPVDRMPRRLPLAVSIVALALVAACFVLPPLLTALSLLFALATLGP